LNEEDEREAHPALEGGGKNDSKELGKCLKKRRPSVHKKV